MRSIAANLLSVLILAGIVLLAAVELARREVSAPGPAIEPVRLTVERGARMGTIADRLAEAGAIGNVTLFRLAASYSGRADQLKFGEYEIAPGASMDEILALLTTGGNVDYQITAPEGWTVTEVVRLLEEADFLTGEVDEMPAEGSLLPETYSVSRGDSRAELIRRMQEAMQAVLDEAWENRDPNLPIDSKDELLVLASIVEKETRPQEHRQVASVFVNRLKRGMKLQSDPTVIYGITGGKEPLGRGIRQSELVAETPYNTYVIEGLPPTPIANPGRESVMATANPENTRFLYFVADGSGGHAFAATLDEHNRNVSEWRRIERQRAAGEAGPGAEQGEPAQQTQPARQ
jgi:UPF0755 protein